MKLASIRSVRVWGPFILAMPGCSLLVQTGEIPTGPSGSGGSAEGGEGGDSGSPASGGKGSGGKGSGGQSSGDGGSGAGGSGGSGTGGDACGGLSTRCTDSAHEQACDAGNWGAEHACPFVCDEETGACGGECVPTKRQCQSDGKTPEECDEFGKWVPEAACPVLCSAGDCATSCEEGLTQCSGKKLMRCTEGSWQEDTSSPCEFICNADADPPRCDGECIPGHMKCAGLDVEVCQTDGFWEKTNSCMFLCKEDVSNATAGCAGSCPPGTSACDNNQVVSCDQDGNPRPGQDCFELEQTCLFSSTVPAHCEGECAPGMVECAGWDVVQCKDGQFIQQVACDRPNSICRMGTPPTCKANNPYSVGEVDTTGWTNVAAVSGNLYVAPVTVTQRAVLQAMRVRIAGLPSGGASGAIGLYKDTAGQPTSLIVAGTIQPLVTGVADAIPAQTVTLDPGPHWIAIQFNLDGVSLGEKNGSGLNADATFPTMPASYPNGFSSPTGKTYPLMLLVQDAPQ